VKNSSEYQKLSASKQQEYLKEKVDSILDSRYIKIRLSDFRKISGTQYFYPYNVFVEFKFSVNTIVIGTQIIKSFKKVSSKDKDIAHYSIRKRQT
jgi:predicted transcriptional regulator